MSVLLVVSAIVYYCAYLALGQFVPTAKDLDDWLATTSADVAFVFNSNFDTPVSDNDIRIIGCTERIGNTCGGLCWAYQAPQGGQCMPLNQNFYRTVCFAMTGNQPICNGTLCSGECKVFSDCKELLDQKFCYAPDASSVQFHQFAPDTWSTSLLNSTPSASASDSLGVAPSPSSSESAVLSPADAAETQSRTLSVGAIVGIAIGSLVALISTILSFYYFRRRQYRKRNGTHAPEPFTAAGWATLATVLPSPQYLRPKKTTRPDDSPAGPPPTSNSFEADHTSSDASNPMEITHKDSGVRIASSSYPSNPQVVVEHPPPYTTT